ncbi:MAG TPA: Swt1 family HEPN domain-containing protein [Terriglobales bacterium]|nr:Swt1 family HEPN domain-containing protein [Terriglobales bacterium]
MSHPILNQLKVFGMQNLMVEADLIKLEKSGVAIDHARTLQEVEVVDVDLFEEDILSEARRMADFYVLYFALENSIRRLIGERLAERYGGTWWEDKVPAGVRTAVLDKQRKERDTPMSIRSEDPLSYANFGELIDILNSNWIDFSDTLRSQKAAQQILSHFNLIRNVIAHSCSLNEDEITRLKLLMKDWFRIQS